MRFLRAAFCAALVIFGAAALAQDVTFTSRDGSIEVEGTLLGFDGEFYRIDTIYGELTLDASGVNCTGPGCPNLETFVAEMRLSGSATMGEVLMPALLQAFASRAGLTAKLVPQDSTHFAYELSNTERVVGRFSFRLTNTDEGFADLLADEADVAMSTREIRAREAQIARAAGLGDLTDVNRSRVIGLDGLVAVTAQGHPVISLSTDTLSRIFSGAITNWNEIGGPDAPIELHLPDAETGFAQAIEDQLLIPAGRKLSESVIRHATPPDVAQAVSKDFLGIGITAFSARSRAHPVTLSGPCGFSLGAARRTIKTEDYPLTAPMFLYLPARRLPKLAREFLAFTRSEPAQVVIRRAGFVDQSPEEISINDQGDRFANAISIAGGEVSLGNLQDMTSLLSGHTRLTTSFRFQAGSARLDAQSRSNVQQLARALERGAYDGRSLMFVGFSDGNGPAKTNLEIAQRRARAVRRAVEEAAETANFDRVTLSDRAFGEALPMACDDTPWGRGVNRRVEVWLR